MFWPSRVPAKITPMDLEVKAINIDHSKEEGIKICRCENSEKKKCFPLMLSFSYILLHIDYAQ